MRMRHRLQFSPADSGRIGQDEFVFTLIDGDEAKRLQFQDDDAVCKRPCSNERLFSDRHRFNLLEEIAAIRRRVREADRRHTTDLPVFGLSVGKGMMCETPNCRGASRDVPQQVCISAVKPMRTDGWPAFNLKKRFLDHSGHRGFSCFDRELIPQDSLDVHHLELCRHPLSMDVTQRRDDALVVCMTASIPERTSSSTTVSKLEEGQRNDEL
mgnify:CR=1 FL=1